MRPCTTAPRLNLAVASNEVLREMVPALLTAIAPEAVAYTRALLSST